MGIQNYRNVKLNSGSWRVRNLVTSSEWQLVNVSVILDVTIMSIDTKSGKGRKRAVLGERASAYAWAESYVQQ